ncbi:MAG: tRNA-dihydrouridine synthase [Gammaproteobacteria bacterium]|nr:tRNA-dihydrouridine synthase [Gammaproteobacteria bacterium]
MKIYLAPMEGVVDFHMRNILTAVGGYDYCVTEFVRVVDRLLPSRVFKRICPELEHGGLTASGTPVIVQILGSDINAMADNARHIAKLGAPGIDINFGCPSKCVNKNDGGAILLKNPHRLYDIVRAVREGVAEAVPVSAKIRLGFDDTDLALENALAVAEAGASFITVHARTRKDGYKAPARWEWLARINQALDIPVVANGDINSVEDYQRCIDISACEQIMIGRGAIARPDLARQIVSHQHGLEISELDWAEVKEMLAGMAIELQDHIKDRYILPRIKQWLVHLKRQYDEAHRCFESVRLMRSYAEFEQLLKNS